MSSPSNNLKEQVARIIQRLNDPTISLDSYSEDANAVLNLILDTILAKLGDDEEGAGDVDNSVFYTNLERRQVRTMLEGLKNG